MLKPFPCVRREHYRMPNGETDLAAYWRAQVANGERCTHCTASTGAPTGEPRQCEECRAMYQDDGAVFHSRRIRCPFCGVKITPCSFVIGAGKTYMEWCGGCEQRYFVEVDERKRFRSPARVKV